MSEIRAYAAQEPGGELMPFQYQAGELGTEEVEVRVQFCGLCYSDVSMIDNEWGISNYPLIPGHEIIGEVVATGSGVTKIERGQKVGVGWYASSCERCQLCEAGDQNLCARSQATIVGRYGGFAERVRCHETWAVVLPDGIEDRSAGPLFCGGITVFNPIQICQVQAGDHVGVVGMGGLGHLAVQFLHHWGCHVTVFTSSPDKHTDAKRLGADEIIDTHNKDALTRAMNHFDFLLVTSNADLHWNSFLNTLRPRGRLHIVGAVPKPIPVPAFSLIAGQRSVSGSALGNPDTVVSMLEFCQRHNIAAEIETYPLSRVNQALNHLRSGKARYRVVLENDF